MKNRYAFLVIGVILMAWGGSSVESHIGASGWARIDLAIFAIGLMLIARAAWLGGTSSASPQYD